MRISFHKNKHLRNKAKHRIHIKMGNKLDFDYKPAPELNICHKDSFS